MLEMENKPNCNYKDRQNKAGDMPTYDLPSIGATPLTYIRNIESTKKAFELYAEGSKQLITLSTAVVALTVTFMKDVYSGTVPNSAKWFLFVAWIVYFLSMSCGVWTLQALTGSLDDHKYPDLMGSNVVIPSLLQIGSFLLGTILIIVVGLVVFIAVNPQQGLINNTKELIIQALRQGDSEILNGVLSDDWSGIVYNGRIINKAQLVEAIKSLTLDIEEITSSSSELQINGDTAIEEGEATVVGKFNNNSFSNKGKFTCVYVKKEGQWRCAFFKADHLIN